MVLAKTGDINVSDNNHLVMTSVEECAIDNLLHI